MSKRKRSDELDAALRADPDYQELRALLSKQTTQQKARLEAALSQQYEGSQRREDAMKKDVDTRIRQLKEDEGKTYAQISEILTQDGYQDSTGNPLSVKAIRSRFYRLTKKERSQPSQAGEPSQEIPPEWLRPLRELIKEEIQSAMTAKGATVAKTDMELPPRRPKREGSREHAGDKATLGGTRIDRVLFDAFHQEREEAGISASELMERILWRHYDRPKLSFEGD